jgi:hypothetical protein
MNVLRNRRREFPPEPEALGRALTQRIWVHRHVARKGKVDRPRSAARARLYVQNLDRRIAVSNFETAIRTTSSQGMVDARSAGSMEKSFITTPAQAAGDIVDGILKNRRCVLIGPDSVAIDLIQRLLPTGYQALVVAGGKLRRKRMIARDRER